MIENPGGSSICHHPRLHWVLTKLRELGLPVPRVCGVEGLGHGDGHDFGLVEVGYSCRHVETYANIQISGVQMQVLDDQVWN